MSAPVGRDGDLYLLGGISSNGDWSVIEFFLAACPKIIRSPSSPSSLIRARQTLMCAMYCTRARSLLRCPLFHFTRILNSKISLSLRCLFFFSLSFFYIFLSLFFSVSFCSPPRCATTLLSPSSDVRSDRTLLQSCHGPLSKFEKSPDRFSFSRFFFFKLSDSSSRHVRKHG